MRCPKCNADIPDQSRFCKFCGNPVGQNFQPMSGTGQSQPVQPNAGGAMNQPVQPNPGRGVNPSGQSYPGGFGNYNSQSVREAVAPAVYSDSNEQSGQMEMNPQSNQSAYSMGNDRMPPKSGGRIFTKVLAWILFAAVLVGGDYVVYNNLIKTEQNTQQLQVNKATELEQNTDVEELVEEVIQKEESDENTQQAKTCSLTPNETSIVMRYGERHQLFVSTDAPDNDPFTFTSDNSHVIVDENGLIFAGEPGATATITVGLKSGNADPVTCQVSVMSEEETFYANIERMNGGTITNPMISIYEDRTKCPKKDVNLRWDESLFYTLEDVDTSSSKDGLIDSYRIEKRQFINEDNGNLIEYEVYCAPETGIINKIVSIENFDNYVEITDYYYDDHGKINFIFQRKDSVYTPTYATRAKKGKRFYFNQDVLVKYRNIEEPFNVTDVVLEKWEVDEIRYASAGKSVKKEYDRLWKRMLDAAYNTYQMVVSTPSVGYLKGYVFDQYNSPLANVDIAVIANEYDYELYHTTTNSDGYYEVMVPIYGGSYRFKISSDNCVETVVSQINMDEGVLDHYIENVYMVQDDGCFNDIDIMVYDVLNKKKRSDAMLPLRNVTLNIREGMNNTIGTVMQTVYTDQDGRVILSLPSGAYTVQIMERGYEDSYFNVFSGHDTFVQNGATPVLKDDEVRIVLTWGQYPNDLDSHLFTPYQGSDGDMQHIGYYDKEDDHGNNLDVDDTSSWGPETMTIKNVRAGTYKYFVADFTNCSGRNYSSYDMSYSGATVRIYNSNGLAGIFFVPYNRRGVIWEVFEIRNGRVIPVQRYYNNVEDKNWWSSGKEHYSSREIDY